MFLILLTKLCQKSNPGQAFIKPKQTFNKPRALQKTYGLLKV